MAVFKALQDGPKVAIFGREPAVWVGIIEGILAVLLSFGLGITQDSYGPWVMLVSAIAGVVTAYLTKDTMLGALTGLGKAFVVWLAVYGLNLSDQQTGAVLGLIPLLVGMWQRTQTSPSAPSVQVDPSPPQVTESPLPAVQPDTNSGGL